MIIRCTQNIISCNGGNGDLWVMDSTTLIKSLEAGIKLNESYQEEYRSMKRKQEASSSDKPFDFNEMQIFGKFNLFCRRLIKLIDMFSTIDEFT
eukprot:scaffold42798_cov387-Skeletonema_marinoi.AAC.1